MHGVHPAPPAVDRRRAHEQTAEPRVQQNPPLRRGVREHRADEGSADHALGRQSRELEQTLGALRQPDAQRALGAGRVHHRERVQCARGRAVAPRIAAAIRAAVAEAVHHEHSKVAREIRDLHLPVARVHDRPRRQQEQRLVAVAVDLEVQALSVALGVPLSIGVARAGLLAHGRMPAQPRARVAADHRYAYSSSAIDAAARAAPSAPTGR